MIQVPTFRSRLGGYDPSEVEPTVRALVQAANAAVAEMEQARLQADIEKGRVVELEMAGAQGADLTLIDIGHRNDRLFTELDQEVRQIRITALAEVERILNDAQQQAAATCNQADSYVASIRSHSEQDAARLLADAQTKANEVTAAAERAAQLKIDQSQAGYDEQRARMAAVTVEFEKTMSDRQDQVEFEFQSRMKVCEAAITEAEQHRAAIEAEMARYLQSRQAEARATLSDAQAHANNTVSQAQIDAEQVRRESEHELQAETARKDAIMSQLSTVRQMLATRLPSKFTSRMDEIAAAGAPVEIGTAAAGAALVVEAEPVKAEPEEAEPEKAEPEKAEPVEPEVVEAEPDKVEPVEAEVVEAEPEKVEPVETEPVETEPVESEVVEAEPDKAEPAKAASAKAKAEKAEAEKAESAKAKEAKAEPVEAEVEEAVKPVAEAPVVEAVAEPVVEAPEAAEAELEAEDEAEDEAQEGGDQDEEIDEYTLLDEIMDIGNPDRD